MDKLYKQIGDEVIEFTEQEYAQVELDKIEAKKISDEISAKETEKSALLARLEMTIEEVKLLLS